MPLLIIFFSVGALLQFFLVYCRSLIVTFHQVEVCAKTREVAELSGEITGAEFHRLLLLSRVYPDPGDDRTEIRAVSAYYNLVSAARAFFGSLAPAVRAWADRERDACAYFAAVTLDRRIAAVRR